jgi:hypothetical protein
MVREAWVKPPFAPGRLQTPSFHGRMSSAIERLSHSRIFVLWYAVLVRIAIAAAFSRSDLRERGGGAHECESAGQPDCSHIFPQRCFHGHTSILRVLTITCFGDVAGHVV